MQPHTSYVPGRARADGQGSARATTAEKRAAESNPYVDERGEDEAAAPGRDIEQLAQLGYTVLAVDPSGIGKRASEESDDSDYLFGKSKIVWLALMVGKPLVELRMDDILRGVDLLSEKGLLYDGQCLGFGKGFVSVDLLHAAVMDQRIAGVVIEDGLLSYASMARTPIQRQVFDTMVPGVLGTYDLPDLVASLAPRPVQLVNMRSPVGNVLFLREVQSEYAYTHAAYSAIGSAGRLRLGRRREDESIAAAYPDLRQSHNEGERLSAIRWL